MEGSTLGSRCPPVAGASRSRFFLHARLLAAGLLALAIPGTASGGDWPLWLGPEQDGTSREVGWLKEWPEEGPPRLFEKSIGVGYSGIAVAGGHAILFHRGRDELLLESLQPSSGDVRWRFAYPTDYRDRYGYNGGPRCMPVVDVALDASRVLALGPKGILHAVALETGKVLWRRDLQGEFRVEQNFFGVGAAPVVEGALVFVHLGGAELGTGRAFALETSTGKVAWQSRTDGGSYAAPRVARVGGVCHLLIFHRGGLSSLDPASGRERWKFPWRSRTFESVHAATPVVVGDLVFCSSSYRTGSFVLRLEGEEKDLVWQDDLASREKAMANHWCTSIHVGGFLYGFSGRHESEATLTCVELETGKVFWRWRSHLGRGSLLYADGHFLALGERGDLSLLRLSPKGYRELGRVSGVLGWPAWTPPTLAHGRLYLRDERRLVCLDLNPPGGNGRVRTSQRRPSPAGGHRPPGPLDASSVGFARGSGL
jgi:outer membrane protein assembly factor BamB